MIHIDDTYTIDADSRCYMLVRRTGKYSIDKDTGEKAEILDTLGYYKTMEAAMTALLRRLHREEVHNHDQTLSEAVRLYGAIEVQLAVRLRGA